MKNETYSDEDSLAVLLESYPRETSSRVLGGIIELPSDVFEKAVKILEERKKNETT